MKFKNLFSERTVMAMESIQMRIARAGRMVMKPLRNAVVLKKTVSMLIVACLVVNLMPVGAFAEDPVSQEMQNKEEKNISTGYVPQGTSDMQTAVAGLEVSVGANGVLKTSDGTIIGSLAQDGDGQWVAMVQPQYAKTIGAGGNKKGDQSLVAVGLDKLNMKAKGQAAEIYKAAIAQSQKKNTQSGQPTVASQRQQGDEQQEEGQGSDRDVSRKDSASDKKDNRIRDSGDGTSTKRAQVDEQSGSEKKDKMWQAIKKRPGDSADVSYISLTMLQQKVAEAGLQFIADRDAGFMGEDTQGFAHFTGDNGSALFVAVAAGQMAYAVPDADGSGRITVGEAENTINTDGVDYAFSGIVLKPGDSKDENANINKDGTKGIFFDSEIQAVKGMEGVTFENAASVAPETDQGVVDALSSLFNSILNGVALNDAQQALLATLGVSADDIKKLGADYLNKAVAYLQNLINNGGTVINCAVDALGTVLDGVNKGVLALQAFLVDIATGNFLKNQTIDGQVMTSMDAIQKVAAANGTDMTAFGVSQEEFWGNLQKMISAGQDGQFVLHIDGNHFVTVDLKDGVLSFKDSLTGDTKTNLSLGDLKNLLNTRFKDGTVNLLTTNASFASKQNKLTENQMKAIVGAMSVAEAQTALSNAQSKVAQSQANLTQAQSTLTEAQAKLADAVAKVQECTAAVETATANYNAAKAARDAAKAAYDACQVPALVESTDPTTGEVTSNASEVAAAEAQKAALAAALQAAEAALAAAQEALSAAQSALSAAQSAQAAAEAEVQAAQAAVQAAQSEVEAAQAAVDAAQAALDEARKLEEAQAKEDEAAIKAAEEALKRAEEAAAAAKAAAEAAAEAAKKAAEAARKAAEDAQKAKEAAAKAQEAAKAAATDVANKRAVQDTTTAKEQAAAASSAMASSIDHAGEAAGESARAKAIVQGDNKEQQEAAAKGAATTAKNSLLNSYLDNAEKNAREISETTNKARAGAGVDLIDPNQAAADARVAAGTSYMKGVGQAAVDQMSTSSLTFEKINETRTNAMGGALLDIQSAAIAKSMTSSAFSMSLTNFLRDNTNIQARATVAGDKAVADILGALNDPAAAQKLFDAAVSQLRAQLPKDNTTQALTDAISTSINRDPTKGDVPLWSTSYESGMGAQETLSGKIAAGEAEINFQRSGLKDNPYSLSAGVALSNALDDQQTLTASKQEVDTFLGGFKAATSADIRKAQTAVNSVNGLDPVTHIDNTGTVVVAPDGTIVISGATGHIGENDGLKFSGEVAKTPPAPKGYTNTYNYTFNGIATNFKEGASITVKDPKDAASSDGSSSSPSDLINIASKMTDTGDGFKMDGVQQVAIVGSTLKPVGQGDIAGVGSTFAGRTTTITDGIVKIAGMRSNDAHDFDFIAVSNVNGVYAATPNSIATVQDTLTGKEGQTATVSYQYGSQGKASIAPTLSIQGGRITSEAVVMQSSRGSVTIGVSAYNQALPSFSFSTYRTNPGATAVGTYRPIGTTDLLIGANNATTGAADYFSGIVQYSDDKGVRILNGTGVAVWTKSDITIGTGAIGITNTVRSADGINWGDGSTFAASPDGSIRAITVADGTNRTVLQIGPEGKTESVAVSWGAVQNGDGVTIEYYDAWKDGDYGNTAAFWSSPVNGQTYAVFKNGDNGNIDLTVFNDQGQPETITATISFQGISSPTNNNPYAEKPSLQTTYLNAAGTTVDLHTTAYGATYALAAGQQTAGSVVDAGFNGKTYETITGTIKNTPSDNGLQKLTAGAFGWGVAQTNITGTVGFTNNLGKNSQGAVVAVENIAGRLWALSNNAMTPLISRVTNGQGDLTVTQWYRGSTEGGVGRIDIPTVNFKGDIYTSGVDNVPYSVKTSVEWTFNQRTAQGVAVPGSYVLAGDPAIKGIISNMRFGDTVADFQVTGLYLSSEGTIDIIGDALLGAHQALSDVRVNPDTINESPASVAEGATPPAFVQTAKLEVTDSGKGEWDISNIGDSTAKVGLSIGLADAVGGNVTAGQYEFDHFSAGTSVYAGAGGFTLKGMKSEGTNTVITSAKLTNVVIDIHETGTLTDNLQYMRVDDRTIAPTPMQKDWRGWDVTPAAGPNNMITAENAHEFVSTSITQTVELIDANGNVIAKADRSIVATANGAGTGVRGVNGISNIYDGRLYLNNSVPVGAVGARYMDLNKLSYTTGTVEPPKTFIEQVGSFVGENGWEIAKVAAVAVIAVVLIPLTAGLSLGFGTAILIGGVAAGLAVGGLSAAQQMNEKGSIDMGVVIQEASIAAFTSALGVASGAAAIAKISAVTAAKATARQVALTAFTQAANVTMQRSALNGFVDNAAAGNWVMAGVSLLLFALPAVSQIKAISSFVNISGGAAKATGGLVTGAVTKSGVAQAVKANAKDMVTRVGVGAAGGAAGGIGFVVADTGKFDVYDLDSWLIVGKAMMIGALAGILSPDIQKGMGYIGLKLNANLANMVGTYVKNYLLGETIKGMTDALVFSQGRDKLAQGTVGLATVRGGFSAAVDTAVFLSVPGKARKTTTEIQPGFWKNMKQAATNTIFNRMGAGFGAVGGLAGFGLGFAKEMNEGWGNDSWGSIGLSSLVGMVSGYTIGNMVRSAGMATFTSIPVTLSEKIAAQKASSTVGAMGQLLGGKLLNGLKKIGIELLPSNFLPRSVGMLQDIVKFNMGITGLGVLLNDRLDGGVVSFINSNQYLSALDNNGLKLSGQIAALSNSESGLDFAVALAGNARGTIADPGIWLFSAAVTIAGPVLRPILTNIPGLGTAMQWFSIIGDQGLNNAKNWTMQKLQKVNPIFASKPILGLVDAVHSKLLFGFEEGIQEQAPGAIAPYLFTGDGAEMDMAREAFQEMFDKRPDASLIRGAQTVSAQLQQEGRATQSAVRSAAKTIASSQDRTGALAQISSQLGLVLSNDVLRLSAIPANANQSVIQRSLMAALVVDQAVKNGLVTAENASKISEVVSGMARSSVIPATPAQYASNIDFMYGMAGVLQEAGPSTPVLTERKDLNTSAVNIGALSTKVQVNFVKGAATQRGAEMKKGVRSAVEAILAGATTTDKAQHALHLSDLASFMSGSDGLIQLRQSTVARALARMDFGFEIEKSQDTIEQVITRLDVLAQNIAATRNEGLATVLSAVLNANPQLHGQIVKWQIAQQVTAATSVTEKRVQLSDFMELSGKLGEGGIQALLSQVESNTLGTDVNNLVLNLAASAALNATADNVMLSYDTKNRLAVAVKALAAQSGELAVPGYLANSIATIDKVNGTQRDAKDTTDSVNAYVAANQSAYDAARDRLNDSYGAVSAPNMELQAMVETSGEIFKFLAGKSDQPKNIDAATLSDQQAAFKTYRSALEKNNMELLAGTYFEKVPLPALSGLSLDEAAASMVSAQYIMEGVHPLIQKNNEAFHYFFPGQKSGFLNIALSMNAGIDRQAQILQTGGGKTFIVAMTALLMRMQSSGSEDANNTFISCFTNTIGNADEMVKTLAETFGVEGLGKIVLLNDQMLAQARSNPNDTTLKDALKSASIVVTTYDLWSGMVASDFAQYIKDPAIKKLFENTDLNINIVSEANGREKFEDPTQAAQIVKILLDAAKTDQSVQAVLDKGTLPLQRIGDAIADEIDFFATIPMQAMAEGMGKYYTASTMARYYNEMAITSLSRDEFVKKYAELGIDRGRIVEDWANHRGSAVKIGALYRAMNSAMSQADGAGNTPQASAVVAAFKDEMAALGVSEKLFAKDVATFKENETARSYFARLADITRELHAQGEDSKGSISISKDGLIYADHSTKVSNAERIELIMNVDVVEDAAVVGQLQQKSESESAQKVDMAALVSAKADELFKTFGGTFTKDQIIEHLWNGMGAYAMEENNEYAVKSEDGRIVVNNLGRGVENLSLPAGMMQVLEANNKLDISKPNAESYISNSVFAMSLFKQIVGVTGTVSKANETSVLGRMKFSINGDAPKVDSSARLFQAESSLYDFIHAANSALNKKGIAAFNLVLTPNSAVSVRAYEKIRSLVRQELMNEATERGEDPQTLQGKAFEALVDSKIRVVASGVTDDQLKDLKNQVKNGELRYVIGDAYLLGRGWDVGSMKGAAKNLREGQGITNDEKIQATCWLIEPELMTESQMRQAAGRIDPFSDNRFHTGTYTKDVVSLYSVENAREVKSLRESVGQQGEWSLDLINSKLIDVQTENEQQALQKAGQNVIVTNERQWEKDQVEAEAIRPTSESAAELLTEKGLSDDNARNAVLSSLNIDPTSDKPVSASQWYQLDRVGKFLDIAAVAELKDLALTGEEIRTITAGDSAQITRLVVEKAIEAGISNDAVTAMGALTAGFKNLEDLQRNLTPRERLTLQNMSKQDKGNVLNGLKAMRFAGIRKLGAQQKKIEKSKKMLTALLDKQYAKNPTEALKMAPAFALLATMDGTNFDEKRAAKAKADSAELSAIGQMLPDDDARKNVLSSIKLSNLSGFAEMNPDQRIDMFKAAISNTVGRRIAKGLRSAIGRPAAKLSPMEMMKALETAGIPGNVIVRIASPVLAKRLEQRAESTDTDTSLAGVLDWLQLQFRTETDNAAAVEGLSGLQSLGALRPEGVLKLQQIASPSASPRADQKKAVSSDDQKAVNQNTAIRVLAEAINNPHSSTELVTAAYAALRTFTETEDAQGVISQYNVSQQSMATDKSASTASPTSDDDMLTQFRRMMELANKPEVIAVQALEKFAKTVLSPAVVNQKVSKGRAAVALALDTTAIVLALTGVAAWLSPVLTGAAVIVEKKSTDALKKKTASSEGQKVSLKQLMSSKEGASAIVALAGLTLGTVLGGPAMGVLWSIVASSGVAGFNTVRSLLTGTAKEDMGRTLAMAALVVDRDPAIAGKISDTRMKAFEKYAAKAKDPQAVETVKKLRQLRAESTSDSAQSSDALETAPVASPLVRSGFALVAGTDKDNAVPLETVRQAANLNDVQLTGTTVTGSLRSLYVKPGAVVMLYLEGKDVEGEDNVGHLVAVTSKDAKTITYIDIGEGGKYEPIETSIDDFVNSTSFAGRVLMDKDTMIGNQTKLTINNRQAVTRTAVRRDAARKVLPGSVRSQMSRLVRQLNAMQDESGVVHCAVVAAAVAIELSGNVAGKIAKDAAVSVGKAASSLLSVEDENLMSLFEGASADDKILLRAIWGVLGGKKEYSTGALKHALQYTHTMGLESLKEYFQVNNDSSPQDVLKTYNAKVNEALQGLSGKALADQLVQLTVSRDLLIAGMKNPEVAKILVKEEMQPSDVAKLASILNSNRLSVAEQCIVYVRQALQKPQDENPAINVKALQDAINKNIPKGTRFGVADLGTFIKDILNSDNAGSSGSLKRGATPDPFMTRGFISAA